MLNQLARIVKGELEDATALMNSIITATPLGSALQADLVSSQVDAAMGSEAYTDKWLVSTDMSQADRDAMLQGAVPVPLPGKPGTLSAK